MMVVLRDHTDDENPRAHFSSSGLRSLVEMSKSDLSGRFSVTMQIWVPTLA